MTNSTKHDAWAAADGYEKYMGRWSRQIATEFLSLLEMPNGLSWLEIGCGTGALSAEILKRSAPQDLTCIDPSENFLNETRSNLNSDLVNFKVASAEALPMLEESMDCVVSALVFNFITDKATALAEMKRVLKPAGTLAFYVWDYPGGGVEFMRAFWTAAVTCDPSAAQFTEDKRFPFCTKQGLEKMVAEAGYSEINTRTIEVSSVFQNFEDLWTPFTLGAGPAPGYCSSLSLDRQEKLKTTLQNQLSIRSDGSIPLNLRAWAVTATKL